MRNQEHRKIKRGSAIEASPRAARIREKIKNWRSKNGDRQLPESLWKTAEGFALEYSTRSVARYLGLSAWQLRMRLRANPPRQDLAGPGQAEQWLELPMQVPSQNQERPKYRPTGLWLQWRSASGARFKLLYREGQQRLLREVLEALQ